jgi:hypothetical protein
MMTMTTGSGVATVGKISGTGRHGRKLLAVLGLIGLVFDAPGAARQGQETRTTQIASMDFAVVRRDGTPVSDLKMDEVTLRIDSKLRPIKSLQFVQASSVGGGAAAAAGPVAAKVAPAFAMNLMATEVAPRSIVIIVDDESMPIGQEIKIRAALTSFVRSLPAADPVALVTVPHGGVKVGFTTDRDRLARAISEISPIMPIDSLPCQTLTVLSTIQGTLGLLTRTSEQPVAVALLSASLSGQARQEAAQRATIGGAGGVSDQAGACHIKADDFVRVGQAVASSRAQFYVIHPDYFPQPVLEASGLRAQTGAPLFHLTSSGEPGSRAWRGRRRATTQPPSRRRPTRSRASRTSPRSKPRDPTWTCERART